MTKRKALSKKVRFEVFKRDAFKCQYCGATAPEAVLEVDHITPVSKDGPHDMMNFVTACKPCNAGKGPRALDDDTVLQKQKAQLQELAQRREQLEMMLDWRRGLQELDDTALDVVLDAWREAVPGWGLNETGKAEAKKLLKKHGLQDLLDAIDTSVQQYLVIEEGKATSSSVSVAWKKVGGILHLRSLPDGEQRLRYIRGILRNRLNYLPYDILDWLREGLHNGHTLEAMEAIAKSSDKWGEYRDWLLRADKKDAA